MNKTNILIVDDHPVLRRGLAMLIEMEPDMEVCGEAEDVTSALEVVARTQPDLVLVDISLKDSDGIQLIKQLKTLHPRIPALVVSMHPESIYAERSLRAGARGYITKQEAEENIIQAIHSVLAGKAYVSESTSESLIQRLSGNVLSPVDLLSDREFEVFQLMGRGLRATRIAEELNLGIKTIETYQARIKQKLSLPDTKALTEHAVAWTKAHMTA